MVIGIICLIVSFLCLLFLAYQANKYRKKCELIRKQWDESDAAAALEKEELDKWKKACWDVEKRFKDLLDYSEGTYTELNWTKAELAKVINQKKSSEVRTGQIAEQLAPFLDRFPYDPKKAHFIGQPIDFVVFDEEGVHFVEVKSGESKLTTVQRSIKEDIEEKRVSFEIFRIKGE